MTTAENAGVELSTDPEGLKDRDPGLQAAKEEIHRPRAFDAHFHLDRTLQKMKLSLNGSLQSVLEKTPVEAQKKVNLIGTCASFCDPSTFPSIKELGNFPPEVKLAIGLHPRHCSVQFQSHQDGVIARVQQLIQSPHVIALGEVGLEHTEPVENWPAQIRALEKLLPLAASRHVVVFHCRGMSDDDGTEVYMLLLHMVKRFLPPEQRIYVHCFNGDEYVRNKWQEAYPGMYFGFTRLARLFNSTQIAALQGIDPSRILLETDAPYFPGHRKCSWSAPCHLYSTAECVAKHLEMSPEELLEVTASNALRLFQ